MTALARDAALKLRVVFVACLEDKEVEGRENGRSRWTDGSDQQDPTPVFS